MNATTKQQAGFTLVEIAIVLVIIGLLLGGILKGQEMITQAKIKNLISDFSGVSVAYHGYVDRYRKIPGDDGDANARWTLGIAAPASGTFNDGIISGAYASATANDESRLFWLHLRRAGFVSGTDQEQPFNAVTGKIGVQTGDAAATPAAVLGGLSAIIVCSANIPDKMAIAIDTQMDDGQPNAGAVRALLQTQPNPPVGTGAAAAANYAETGTNTYTLCRAL
ncbi:MAG TPA: prepilin-type N-terminal cleavage/methylation domain-containing protein [Burkholderiales bacterium]|nr:prepilin-type N-terminal cleavage/methylation domain-containing protein [Burkholderiales bacterium]